MGAAEQESLGVGGFGEGFVEIDAEDFGGDVVVDPAFFDQRDEQGAGLFGGREAEGVEGLGVGVGGRVALPGHVNPVSDALLAADALVMSSDYEGVPAVVPEALAAGLPVVSTDCSVSMADLLGHGRFGLLVPVRDEAALAGAMDRITALPFDSTAARAQARRFTVEIAAQSYVVEMQRLVHG